MHVIGVTCHWDSCHHPEWDANSIIDLCPLLSQSEGGEERRGWRALPSRHHPHIVDTKLPLKEDSIDEAAGSDSAGHSSGVGTIEVGEETTSENPGIIGAKTNADTLLQPSGCPGAVV